MRHCLILLLPTLLAAAPPNASRNGSPRSVNELKAFVQAACTGCHGVDGAARSSDGKKLKGQDFTDLREMRHKKDVKLALTIRNGILFGKVMPAFKDQLSEAEAALIVAEIVRKAEKGKAIAPEPSK